MEEGVPADELAAWVKEEQPNYDWKTYGFQEFGELLNYAQDKSVVRIQPDETRGLMVMLGPEFHPPAVPEPAPVAADEEQPEDEKQPEVPGQPTARGPRVKRSTRKTAGAGDGTTTSTKRSRKPGSTTKRVAPRRSPRLPMETPVE
jgi:hypothetical protein